MVPVKKKKKKNLRKYYHTYSSKHPIVRWSLANITTYYTVDILFFATKLYGLIYNHKKIHGIKALYKLELEILAYKTGDYLVVATEGRAEASL